MPNKHELDHQYRMRRIQFWQDVVRRGLSTLVGTVWAAGLYFSVRELAGRATTADIAFKILADLKANQPAAIMASWLLTTGSVGWAASERYLRRRYIKKHHPIVRRYQELLDKERGSSGLTQIGTTQEGDI